MSPRRADASYRAHSCSKHRAKGERNRNRTVRDCTCATVRHVHGTVQAYNRDGCHCAPCTTASRRYEKLRLLRTRRNGPLTVDPAPVVAHVRRLMAAGLGAPVIGTTAGLSRSTVPLLLRKASQGRAHLIRRDSALRLLAVNVASAELTASPLSKVDAAETWRRAHALMALGYSRSWIGRQITGNPRGRLTLAVDAVTRRNAAAILALYERVGDTPAPPSKGATQARNEAARRGWPPPILLDGDDLPPPDGEVDEVAVRRAVSGEPVSLTAREQREAVAHMGDLSGRVAAERAGVNRRTVCRWRAEQRCEGAA